MKRLNKIPKGAEFKYQNERRENIFMSARRVYVRARLYIPGLAVYSYSLKEWESIQDN